jgi:hypothetical protein
MSDVGGFASDSATGPAGPALRRRRMRRWSALAVLLLAVTAVSVLLVGWAVSFQPLGFGGTGFGNEYYPGLPTGVGIREVNTFRGVREDIYIPPQPGTFSLFVDLTNNGNRAVTIESVTLPRDDGRFEPLTPAGPVIYSAEYPGSLVGWKTAVLRNVTLAPGSDIYIGIPVRTWPCGIEHSWITVPSFSVTYNYLVFTHTVAVAWGNKNDELIMQEHGGRPGQPGIFCGPERS